MEIPLEQEFFGRCAAHQKLKRSGGEGPYFRIFGDYAGTSVAATEDTRISVQEFLVRRIKEYLDGAGDEPVIALDAGGGVGMTWLKLAGCFQEEVREGRLVLAVSLLDGGPLDYLKLAVDTEQLNPGITSVTRWQLAARLLERFGSDVQYIHANFSAHDDPAIIWGDERLSLRGKVDLLHESSAVTSWSKVPALHVPRLARLTSPRGIYMVEGNDVPGVYGRMKSEEAAARRSEIMATHESLSTLAGLTMTQTVECGALAGEPLSYVIHKGPAARPIEVG